MKFKSHCTSRNKYTLLLILCLCVLIFSTCASVNSQGIRYFVGKSENDLIGYFGYNGSEVEVNNDDYDKILHFTNRIIKYQMFKTKTVRYKVSRNSRVFQYLYAEYNDGCLCQLGTMHLTSADSLLRTPVRHVNDNLYVRDNINRFNSEINRLRSVTPEYFKSLS